jgi:hypothetical protein
MEKETATQGLATEYSPSDMDLLLRQMKDIPTHPDGRASLADLYSKHYELEMKYGFTKEVIYTIPIAARGNSVNVPVFCYISPQSEGADALVVMTGIHGEEPAPPNAVFRQIDEIRQLGAAISLCIMPMCNPAGYYRNWRFHDRPFSLERRNVTDARHLLSDWAHQDRPMLAAPQMEISGRFSQFFLGLNIRFPVRLFFDLHEDATLTEGYIYSHGYLGERDPVARSCAQLLLDNGVKLKMNGGTRFSKEVIYHGLVSDQNGSPVRDGSIDHLAAAPCIFEYGKLVQKHAAHTSIVAETPTAGTITLDERIRAHEAIIKNLRNFWDVVESKIR